MIRISCDKKDLIKQLNAIHGVAIFERGRKYYQKGVVGELKISDHRSKEKVRIVADVYGSDAYNTEIIFNFHTDRFSQPKCSCPYEWGECKHSVALGLKFIDLWEETCQKENEFRNFEEIKKLLISFAKISKNNSKEKYENADKAVDYEEYYNEDDERYGEEDVIDISDKNGRIDFLDKQEKEKERLKKLLQIIGIDAASLSAEVLSELKNNLLVRSGKGETKKAKSGNFLKEEKKKPTRNIADHYHLVLETKYVLCLKIAKNNSQMFYWENDAKNILKTEKNNLTSPQRELLESLSAIDYWYETSAPWGNLFLLAKDSGLEIFINNQSEKNRLSFKENHAKLTVEIYRKETEHHINYGEVMNQDDFTFKLIGNFYKEKSIYSLCGPEHIVKIDKNKIAIHPVTPRLLAIAERILEAGRNYYNSYYYNYQNREEFIWETDLNEEEIIEINEILTDAREYFNFITNLPESFEVKKYQKIGPVMLVDYDSENQKLSVRATVDYDFSKIDVAHTVYKSMKGGVASFQGRIFPNREKLHLLISEQEIHYANIAHKEERKLFSKFHLDEKYGFTKTLKCVRENSKKVAHYCENHWPQVKEAGYPIEFLRDRLDISQENFTAAFEVDMNAENDWLAFDVDCYLGRDRISLEDLKNYLKNKEEFIRMNDGRMLKISNWEELERFILMLESFYQRENGSFEGRAYHAPELKNIFANSKYYSAKVAEGFKKFIAEAQSGRPIEKVKLPAKIGRTLRDYQKEGISWFHFLRKYRFAGILADDMGLGKTLQALTLLHMRKIAGKPSLVVCPKTLLFNWEEEVRKFFPNLKTLIIEGAPKDRVKNIGKIKNYDLAITSYSTIKKDSAVYEKKKVKFNYCFLDEAQFIKNHRTQNAQAVKKIDAEYKLALTGTPLENSVSEIWSVFDFLMPGFLGNYNHFTKKFLTPIMKHSDVKAMTDLRKKTECFMLRRTKGEVLKELPPKIEQTVASELTEAQNILYQEILANVKSEIFQTVSEKGFSKSQIHILAGLMKLRQVCNHPTLLLKNKDYTKYSSAKLESFKELINEIVSANRKVLVFSQFTQMLDILADVLDKDKIEYLYLSGKTKNRKELVDEFNGSGEKKVFLISLKAGGTGLNLTSADNVIIFDPWWNPSVENQAIDRTHRIGQKNSVNVYRLITKGTIEERILKLQEKKKFLFDNLVGESKDLFNKLTWDDVKELFR